MVSWSTTSSLYFQWAINDRANFSLIKLIQGDLSKIILSEMHVELNMRHEVSPQFLVNFTINREF